MHLDVPRCTLEIKNRPRCALVMKNVPKVRIGFPGCTSAHQGAPWVSKAHPGKPRRTLGTFFISKAHLGRVLYFHQGASWHIKAHLGTSRRALAHQGSPWHTKVRLGFPGCTLGDHWQTKARLGKARVPFQGAPQATFSRSRRTRGCKTGPGCIPDDLTLDFSCTLMARN